MAKSLRSKRRRKIRAEKRIVNAKKELVKLKEVAAKLHGTSPAGKQHQLGLTKESLESTIPDVHVSDCPMQIDSAATATGSKKSSAMKINNQWMNQRKIKSIKGRIKKHNQKKARRGQSAGLSSRKAKKGLKK